jgi:hypothetical protein
MNDVINFLARIIGVADLPWQVRMYFGLLIGLVLLYVGTIFVPVFTSKADMSGVKTLQEWTMDALKIIIGAVVGVLSLPPH